MKSFESTFYIIKPNNIIVDNIMTDDILENIEDVLIVKKICIYDIVNYKNIFTKYITKLIENYLGTNNNDTNVISIDYTNNIITYMLYNVSSELPINSFSKYLRSTNTYLTESEKINGNVIIFNAHFYIKNNIYNEINMQFPMNIFKNTLYNKFIHTGYIVQSNIIDSSELYAFNINNNMHLINNNNNINYNNITSNLNLGEYKYICNTKCNLTFIIGTKNVFQKDIYIDNIDDINNIKNLNKYITILTNIPVIDTCILLIKYKDSYITLPPSIIHRIYNISFYIDIEQSYENIDNIDEINFLKYLIDIENKINQKQLKHRSENEIIRQLILSLK